MQYANLNQPQTITAPTNVAPYSEFSSKLAVLSCSRSRASLGSSQLPAARARLQRVELEQLGFGLLRASLDHRASSYSKCISEAGGDVAKMQHCASLLNGG